jgi:hypothetical protein
MSEVKYFHLRSGEYKVVDNKGGMTFAWQIKPDGIYVSYAVCSVKDNFNKKVGRELATKRLEEGIVQIINTEVIVKNYIPQIQFPFVTKILADKLRGTLTVNDLSLYTIKQIIINEVALD